MLVYAQCVCERDEMCVSVCVMCIQCVCDVICVSVCVMCIGCVCDEMCVSVCVCVMCIGCVCDEMCVSVCDVYWVCVCDEMWQLWSLLVLSLSFFLQNHWTVKSLRQTPSHNPLCLSAAPSCTNTQVHTEIHTLTVQHRRTHNNTHRLEVSSCLWPGRQSAQKNVVVVVYSISCSNSRLSCDAKWAAWLAPD